MRTSAKIVAALIRPCPLGSSRTILQSLPLPSCERTYDRRLWRQSTKSFLPSERHSMSSTSNIDSLATSESSPIANLDDISKLRKEYSSQGIDESNISSISPLDLFAQWFKDAQRSDVLEPNAMCLATASKDTCMPSARYVLLKTFDDRGFVWFTNYNSRKGDDLAANPNAALCFWWGELERSVRVEGKVEKVSAEESDAYFNSRPVNARLGAVGSDQSSPIDSRKALDGKFEELEREHLDENGNEIKRVERPPHWGGYRLVPNAIEFWKGRKSRVHDRLRYTLDVKAENWNVQRLQP